MLTDFSWLATGEKFPPPSEVERLNKYNQNKKIFDNKHHEVYSKQWKRVEKVIGVDANTIEALINLNFQKKISLKTADFLFMEKPKYKAFEKEETTDSDGNKVKKEIDIKEITDSLDGIDAEGTIDISRFGDAVYKVNILGEGQTKKGTIGISTPEYLFTITSVEDMKTTTGYVLAWEFETGSLTNNNLQKHLKATIHTKTTKQTFVYDMDGGIIGALADFDAKPIPTGLDDFAIIPISNVKTSDRIYGIDDYQDVDSVVSEIEVRVSQISKILDVHASPSLTGSVELLTIDPVTDEATIDLGNFLKRNHKDEPEPKYLVWEANLIANFTQIDKLITFLSVLSEMGAAIFNDDAAARAGLSGTALKKLYINVLAKVARIRKNVDKGFKKAISLASQIGHIKITPDQITITWGDGLPNDELEEATIMGLRLPQIQQVSRESMNVKYDEMTPEQAEDETVKIADEQADLLGQGIPPVFDSTQIDEGGEPLDTEAAISAVNSEVSYNGAQVQAAVSIAEQVAQGTLAKETAILMLQQFLRISKEDATKIVEAQLKLKIPKE